MNNEQHSNTFGTRKFLGNAPGKTHKGKTSQGDFLLIELIGKILSYNSKNISAINTVLISLSQHNVLLCQNLH
jgi:hypothetical protein